MNYIAKQLCMWPTFLLHTKTDRHNCNSTSKKGKHNMKVVVRMASKYIKQSFTNTVPNAYLQKLPPFNSSIFFL